MVSWVNLEEKSVVEAPKAVRRYLTCLVCSDNAGYEGYVHRLAA